MSTEPVLLFNEPEAENTVTVDMPKRGFPWMMFLLLSVVTVITSLLIVPYTIKLGSIGMEGLADNPGLLYVGTLIQAVVLNIPALLVGLFVARRLSLGLPHLEAAMYKRQAPGGFKRGLIFSALVGFGGGVVLLLLAGAFASVLPAELTGLSPDSLPTPFEGFLASISAGFNEEVLLRLFMLSLIAWGIQAVVARRTIGRPGTATLWVANVLAAVIFGLLHMGNLAIMDIAITPVLILYIIVMNGLVGLGFGWLYWTFGLELAILAHFFTDIVLHVIAAAVAQ